MSSVWRQVASNWGKLTPISEEIIKKIRCCKLANGLKIKSGWNFLSLLKENNSNFKRVTRCSTHSRTQRTCQAFFALHCFPLMFGSGFSKACAARAPGVQALAGAMHSVLQPKRRSNRFCLGALMRTSLGYARSPLHVRREWKDPEKTKRGGVKLVWCSTANQSASWQRRLKMFFIIADI